MRIGWGFFCSETSLIPLFAAKIISQLLPVVCRVITIYYYYDYYNSYEGDWKREEERKIDDVSMEFPIVMWFAH